jgi:tripartite-type tricarboxylate transporter receptor subunit TctC
MKSVMIKLAVGIVVLSGIATNALPQTAADFPNRMVKIIVPHPAGGGPDVFTRLIAEKLAARWKQPIIVENRAGGASNIGASQVAHADPDGYTLLAAAPAPIAINGGLFKTLSYDPEKWTAVTVLTRQPMLLGARKELAANSVQELITLAKQSPDKFTYGSLGFGSISQLTMIRFLSMAGAGMVHVPFTGSSPALVALMAGQVDIVFDNPVTYIPPFKDSRIKILAGGDDRRLPMLPDTPTFAESGFPNLRPYAWLAVVAPPDTPGVIVETISKAMAETLALPEIKKDMDAFVTEPVGSDPVQTAKFLHEERTKWRAVIQAANLSVD